MEANRLHNNLMNKEWSMPLLILFCYSLNLPNELKVIVILNIYGAVCNTYSNSRITSTIISNLTNNTRSNYIKGITAKTDTRNKH